MPASRPRYRPTRCRRCPARAPQVQISYGGLCPDCAETAVERSIRAMVDKSGPEYERWRESMRAAAERQLESA